MHETEYPAGEGDEEAGGGGGGGGGKLRLLTFFSLPLKAVRSFQTRFLTVSNLAPAFSGTELIAAVTQ